jgi:uncharacterized membrane protein
MSRRRIIIIILILFVVIQFIRPARNISAATSPGDIAQLYPVPDDVRRILEKACNDCHSNHTNYPWYSNIQPVGWWLQHHVNDGKEELNFSEFSTYTPKRQYHKLRETAEQVEKKEMPLDSYMWIHPEARLTDEERKVLTDWAKSLGEEIATKNNLPKESER